MYSSPEDHPLNDLIPILIVAGIIVVSIVLVIMLIQHLLIVVPPNRVLVISGRSRQTAEGDTVGYRVIRGGPSASRCWRRCRGWT